MKQESIFVVPKEGVKVRDEHGQSHIPPEGDTRILTTYYNRRIGDGDLIIREMPMAPIDAPRETTETNLAGGKAGKAKGEK